MPPRRLQAVLADVRPRVVDGACAVALRFRPVRGGPLAEPIDDLAPLGPELELEAVRGLGKVLRLLRAARLAPPTDPHGLLGRPFEVSRLLGRAVGTTVWLEVMARPRIRFRAWTDQGVEEVEDVAEVVEAPDAWLVMRQRGQPPVRLPRETVARTRTERETWYQVVGIDS